MVDYDDLQLMLYKLLKENDEIKRHLSNQYRFIMVDEFQDTNELQWSIISELGNLRTIREAEHDGPAQRYQYEGAIGEIGFIPAISQHFCNKCNRLRLTASGQLRPCLLCDHQEDLKAAVRQGCSDHQLADIFIRAVRHKPSDHNLFAKDAARVCGQMSAIGG